MEDSSWQIRSGVRGKAAAEHKKREHITFDPVAMNHFDSLVNDLKEGKGVSFPFDKEITVLDTLTSVEVPDEEEDDGSDGETGDVDDDDDDKYENELVENDI